MRKTNYPKIDIYVATLTPSSYTWKYVASTTWSKTLREAKTRYYTTHAGISAQLIKAKFAKGESR